jgi:hypothetical protein
MSPRFRLSSNLLAILLAVSLLLAGCRSPELGQEQIHVRVVADGQTRQVEVQAGSTAGQALEAAGLDVSNLDKSDPPAYTVLSDGDEIHLTRVREEFTTEEVTIPFEQQIARNESLPEGETRLVQPGVSGQQELTYRILLEDGQEVSRTVVKTVTLREAVPEIVMVGAQSAYAPLVIPGLLVYLAAGNAWLMEGTTANRRALATWTGVSSPSRRTVAGCSSHAHRTNLPTKRSIHFGPSACRARKPSPSAWA